MFKNLSALVLSLALLLSAQTVYALPTIDNVENTEESTGVSVAEQPLKKVTPTESDVLSGSGVEADPYLVTGMEDLSYIAERVNAGDTDYSSAFYRQTADIVLSDSFVPIGTSDHPFTGVYDGTHHRITLSDYTVTTAYDKLGVFGHAQCAVFKNIALQVEAEITYTGTSNVCVGALCGYYTTNASAGGTFSVSGCSASGRFQTHAEKATSEVGGLFGEIAAKTGTFSVADCFSSLTIQSDSKKSAYAAGIVGKASTEGTGKLTLERLFAKSHMQVSCSVNAYAGGIVGYYAQDDDSSWSGWYSTALLADASSVCNLRNCASDVTLSAEGARITNIGYLCAWINAYFKSENCYYAASGENTSSGSPFNGTKLSADELYTETFLSDTLHLSLGDSWRLDGEALYVLHPCLNASLDGQTLNVRVSDCEKAKLFVGFFDEDGRMVSSKLSDTEAFADQTVPFTCPAASDARIFLWNGQTLSPLIEDVTLSVR